MNCEKVSNLISAYLDREVSEDEERKIRHHLAYCADCYSDYSKLKGIKNILDSLEEEDLPEGFWEPTKARLKYEQNSHRIRTWTSIFTPFAAAACLLLMISIFSPKAGQDRLEHGVSGFIGSNSSSGLNSYSRSSSSYSPSGSATESNPSSQIEVRSYGISGSPVTIGNTRPASGTRDSSLRTSVFIEKDLSSAELTDIPLEEYSQFDLRLTLTEDD